MRRRVNAMEKYFCMQCRSTQWMRELPDNKDKCDGWKCIICGTIHKSPSRWKRSKKT